MIMLRSLLGLFLFGASQVAMGQVSLGLYGNFSPAPDLGIGAGGLVQLQTGAPKLRIPVRFETNIFLSQTGVNGGHRRRVPYSVLTGLHFHANPEKDFRLFVGGEVGYFNMLRYQNAFDSKDYVYLFEGLTIYPSAGLEADVVGKILSVRVSGAAPIFIPTRISADQPNTPTASKDIWVHILGSFGLNYNLGR
jgi:hypothetical protein